MRRLAAVLISCVLMTGAIWGLVGCGGGGSRETETERTVTVWLHKSKTEDEGKTYGTLMRKFNESNVMVDGKQVIMDIEYLSDATTLRTRLVTAKMNHELPDIIAVDAPGIARYANDGVLIPMEDYIDEKSRADYVDSVIQQSTYNGHLYALSGMDAPAGLYYNKTLLDSVGLTAGTIENPWSWKDLENAMLKLKKANKKYQIQLNRAFGGDSGAMYLYSNLVYSAGGEFVGKNGKVSSYLNSDKAVAGLSAYASLYSKNGTNKWIYTGGSTNAFPAGDVAFEIHGSWLMKTIENYSAGMKDEWGVMPVPVYEAEDGTKGEICTPCGSWGFGISADCKDSFKSSAAAVIKYLTGAESSLRFYNDINTFPTSKSVLQGEVFQTGQVKALSDLLVQTAKARPVLVNFATLETQYKNVMEYIEQDAAKSSFDLKGRLNTACNNIDNT